MTAIQAMEWMLPLGLVVAVLIGAMMVLTTLRISWIKNAIAITTVLYGLLGGILVLSPKWQSFIAESDGKSLKIQITELEGKLKVAQNDNAHLQSQIDKVAQLNDKSLSAAEWLAKAKTTKDEVKWAKFLPTETSSFKIQVQPSEDSSFEDVLSATLGKPTAEIEQALKDTGYTVLRKPTNLEFMQTPAAKFWVDGTKPQ